MSNNKCLIQVTPSSHTISIVTNHPESLTVPANMPHQQHQSIIPSGNPTPTLQIAINIDSDAILINIDTQISKEITINPITPVAQVRTIVIDRFTARLRVTTGQPQPPVSEQTPSTMHKQQQPERETTGTNP